MARLSFLLLIVALAAGVTASAAPALGGTEDGWVIRSFDARYVVNEDGTVDATEDLRVDFSALERHGIFRDMPVEYAYNDESNRLIDITQCVGHGRQRPGAVRTERRWPEHADQDR